MAHIQLTDTEIEMLWREDMPLNDVTTDGMGISNVPGRVCCWPKADGVVAGVETAARLFELSGCTVVRFHSDGDFVAAKEHVMDVTGTASELHAVYKVAQGIMEYSSGIAGRVRAMVINATAVNPTVRVAMTRKHFPGSKKLSLAAALAGGAIVHRNGLSDSILVFDQHRCFSSDIPAALRALKLGEPEKKVAVEAASVEEGLEYVKLGVDIVQCERFSSEDLARFVAEGTKINPALIVNAAGGVNADNAAQYAATGAHVLVTSWPYFGKPFDIKMAFEGNEI